MDHKVLVEELIRGRNTAVKLLEQAQASPETPPDPVLLKEVLGSFSNVLSALEVAAPDSSPPKVELTTSCCSEENSKKRKAQSAPKRNGHRRRSSSDVCRTVLKTTEDGYTWRKYGQKEIYGAKFPRSYFRCTHKYDRDCQALRQVQQSEEDPSMYEITYFGEHTCMQLHTTSADSSGHIKAACIIDFAASKATGEMINCAAVHHQLETPFASTAAAAAAAAAHADADAHADAALPQPKQECEEEVLSNLTPGAASSSDLLSVSDFPGFEEASFQYDVSSSLVLYPLDEFPDIF